MALVEQKRDDDYEEDMFCRLLFIFLSLAATAAAVMLPRGGGGAAAPFLRLSVSHSSSLSKMHCIQTIGLAFNGHTH